MKVVEADGMEDRGLLKCDGDDVEGGVNSSTAAAAANVVTGRGQVLLWSPRSKVWALIGELRRVFATSLGQPVPGKRTQPNLLSFGCDFTSSVARHHPNHNLASLEVAPGTVPQPKARATRARTDADPK